ncbi:MAG: hypothetical protein CBB68_02035 [Rhodospirillaceae bacterium TMED8]|nr:DsbE family thiol:disulfide interchange protein [Magnetovibrio sp.]OUT52157.1 MAG: hypothetical protein CBB68_02035 [Rhodospirillaceae bacterium TMED8]|tara:strand:+ start:497 stop:1060 length:564 start_codon:yes stop_codon:yes gene_type:complete
MKQRAIFILPLIVFCIIGFYLAKGLTLDPKKMPSMLDGKPVPTFSLPPIKGRDNNGFSQNHLLDKVALVNIFGSWCVACRIEHPFLMQLSELSNTPIHGINWREENPDSGPEWLKRHGDPYEFVGDDPRSKAAIAFGVTGAPETFLVDQEGIIRYKHVGPLDLQTWRGILWPLIQKLSHKNIPRGTL